MKPHLLRWLALVTLFLTDWAIAETAHPMVPPLPITIEGRPAHPCVYVTTQDFADARERVKKYAWAQRAAKELLTEADRWADMDEAKVLALVPPPGACYAYGHSGCPVCKQGFAGWWGAGGAASLDDPGHVVCVKGHRLPDDQHPDAGHGYTEPATGTKFYFIGTFNAYAIDQMTTGITRLVHAYGLTQDDRYADRAALMLDHLARIYPTSETGSVDYPSTEVSGRFNRPWYQVARMLVYYANAYDILMGGNALSKPSSVEGLTRRENIERNLLLNGALYCYQQAVDTPALHNGTADYQRGQMVVAAAMGIPQYMAYAVDGPFGFRNMVENNIDRDGQYYETSSLYSGHAGHLYADMAEIVKHYRDERYPEGINVAASPKFRNLLLLSRSRLDAGGLMPSLGDDEPNLLPAKRGLEAIELEMIHLEHLAALTDDPNVVELLRERTAGRLDEQRGLSRQHEWLLFHAVDVEAAKPPSPTTARQPTGLDLIGSDLLAQRGLAILRDGKADTARAVTLRAGPTLNHGHFDEMNLNVYARGWEMTYDIGYKFGSTHAYQGFGRQTASHNLVLVNETSQMKSGRTGGTIEEFVTLPGMTFVRASNPVCYEAEGVTRYERSVALVKIDEQDSYALDLFRVAGGQKHDYIFHARGTDVALEGVALGEPAKGSLAGPDVRWGELIGADGNASTEPNRPNWNPPPGNGLGFLMHPRHGPLTDIASVTWRVAEDAHLRLSVLPTQKADVVLADAPGLYRTSEYPESTYALVRRAGGEGLKSTFCAVIEPFGAERRVREIKMLKGSAEASVGVRVELSNGRTHLLLQSPTSCTWQDGSDRYELDEGFAKIELADGVPTHLDLVGGHRLNHNTLQLTTSNEQLIGRIVNIDEAGSKIEVVPWLSSIEPLGGEFISIGNAAYGHRTNYRVERIVGGSRGSTVHLTPTTFVLARGKMAEPPTGNRLPNIVPTEYAKSLTRVPSGFYRGKRVTNAEGTASTNLINIDDPGACLMDVQDASEFKAGDELIVHDIQVGDDVRIPLHVSAVRDGTGEWKTSGTASAKVNDFPSTRPAQ